ncbi:MAG TPA: hypothetical protein VIL49_08215 [Capillimicrobium sp.]|jgi:hypothetical protein
MSRLASARPSLALGAALLALAAAPAAATAAPAVRVTVEPIASDLSAKASTRVVVRNAGKRRVRGLTLTVAPPQGVTARLAGARKGGLSRALPPLAPGARARVKVTLRRAGDGPPAGAVTVRVARRGKAIASGELRFGGGGPAPDPNTLAGRYFWASQYTINGTIQRPLYFGDGFVWVEEQFEDAWPVCAAASETCLPYSYDGRTRALTIGGQPAAFEGSDIMFDEQRYFALQAPPAGARWDTTVTYANSSGLCPLMCSYYREDLTFLPDGTFIRGGVSSGTGPVVDWAVVPDDDKGTYEVRADGTLRLAFADGTERVDTVALFLADDGTLEPPGEGIVLDGDGYFDIRDE